GRAVGAIGPVKLDLTGAVDVSVSGQATFDVSMEVLVSMGLTYDDGTLDTSSDADLLGDGSMSSTTEVAISAGVTGTAQATLFGITGFEIETGPTLSASYDAAGCFKVEASYQTSLSYVVKRWGADWTLSIGTSTVGPITIYQNDQCAQWTGSATVTDVQGPVWLGAVSGHRTYSVTIDNIENCIVSAGAILLCTGTG
ncbi:MAG TPA: hypothetical protein DCR14_17400, partial [Acidimicrobiaceae bacterium]|nr:hypothetical protein [Acidimicrobiaceae bacterium]